MVDFRSDRMETPEGRGIALSRWDALGGPPAVPELKPRSPINPLAKKVGGAAVVDLVGFWVLWHLRGGFEGLRGIGLSRSSIYRRIGLFRLVYGQHPDEYEFPWIKLDLEAYKARPKRS